MKNNLKFLTLFLVLVSFSSCELHKQDTIVPPPVVAKKTDLSIIDSVMVTVLNDDIKGLERILSGNTDIDLNTPDESGTLILNQAVKLNRIFIGEVLLKYGADPTLEDIEGLTAESLGVGSEISLEWENLFTGSPLSEVFLTDLVLKAISETAQDTQQDTISKLDLYFERGAPFDGVNESKYSYLMVASSNDLVQLAQHLCSYPELDPTYTVTIIRRRREYQINATYFATSNEMKATLSECGLKNR